MSLKNSIVVARAIAESGLLEPVQCSENLQVAINNSDHITVLDPKLPLLHNWITKGGTSSSPKKIIDTIDLYDVRTIFNIADLELLGFQIFSRLLIEDGEDQFSFGRISEPSIVAHTWSPLIDTSKDCYLGVLLNTGEVLILRRTTQDANQYDMVFRSFTCLLDQLNIPQNRLTSEGDIIISNAENLELKLTSFTFGKSHDGSLYILLAHQSGLISLHSLSPGLPEISRVNIRGTIVKQAWADDLSTLAVLLSDNSLLTLSFDEQLKELAEPHLVKQPSRFLVSHLKFLPFGQLVVTDTRGIYVIKNGFTTQTTLPYRSNILGLSFASLTSGSAAFLTYESGHLLTINISESGECSVNSTSPAWTSFVNRNLLQFQYACLKEQNKAPAEVFKPLLNDKIEGNLLINGSHMDANGNLVLVYNISPKNVIHHEIRSKSEFRVAIVPGLDIETQIISKNARGTSISQIHGLLIREFPLFPVLQSNGIDALKSFLEGIQTWKTQHFIDAQKANLGLPTSAALTEMLKTAITQNQEVADLQKLFTFNACLKNTLEALTLSQETSLAVSQARSVIDEEQGIIKSKIAAQYRHAVLLQSSFDTFNTEADKFIQVTFAKVLPIDIQRKFTKLPNEVKLTESTDLVTESFSVTNDQNIDPSFERYALSDSSHLWRRCDLTMLPILSLNNRADELDMFVYSLPEHAAEGLASTLQSVLDFCIYTGNRIFELKVGL